MKLILYCVIFAIISFASAGINTWGFNSAGELGSGISTIGQIITTPSPINGTLFKENIQDICCGENFCVALASSGAMYSWGDNTVGQLGDLSGVNQASPVRVKTNERVGSISCGQGHVLAVTVDSKVLAWGWNYRGQVADSMDKNVVPAPQRIKFFDQDQQIIIIRVAAGYQHSMAMSAHGIVYTWGDNSMGQLGTGKNDEQPFSNVPQSVKKLSGPSYVIGAGEDHSFAAALEGDNVFAWGDNSVGQLGTGSISDQPIYLPVLVNVTNMMNHGTDISKIIGGAAHTLLITNNNELFVWGGNSFGQLGLGDQIDRWVPTLLRLPNGMKVKNVAGGLLHSLVVDSDGNVWAFGGNATGQLGDGDQQDSNSPVKTSVTSASHVAAGKFFSASLN